MVDICQEGRSQRSVPQRRHTAHLRWRSYFAPRKLSGWERGGDKTHCPTWGECAHQAHWAAQTWEGHKRQAQQSLRLCGVPENKNLSGLDLGSAYNPGPTLDSSPAEQPGAWAVQTGKARPPWVGANPVWSIHCEHAPRMPVMFICSVPPSPQHDRTSEPK